MKKGVFIIIVIAISLATIFSIIGISANNKEKMLRIKIGNKQKECGAYYDKMWKIISQEAKVADQYKEAFKEIYPALIEGRYANDKGTFMKWITESNPTFNTAMYEKLMNSIEAERTGFYFVQKQLIDLDNEHKIIRSTFPNSIFIGTRPDVEIMIVTSAKTKDVMLRGEENDITLF